MKMLDGSKDPSEFDFDYLAWGIVIAFAVLFLCAIGGG